MEYIISKTCQSTLTVIQRYNPIRGIVNAMGLRSCDDKGNRDAQTIIYSYQKQNSGIDV